MSNIATIEVEKKTVLADTHNKLGAIMGNRDGCAVPLSYGDVDSEYAAVRDRKAGLIDLSSRTRVNVSGSEAVQFLNGLITNDVKTLEEGTWMPAAFPNVQGRLLANVRVLNRSNSFLIDTEPATREAVLSTLQRFTLAGDFHVAELTAEIATISLQGAGAQEIIGDVLGAKSAEVSRYRIVNAEWTGGPVSVIRATYTSENGFDLFVAAATASDLWEALRVAGAEPVGFEALDVLRIEAGQPRHGVDIDATNVVLESGLDDAISFTKGCYVGQEIIARIHWRGHVAKKIGGLIFDEAFTIRKGDLVRSTEGKEIGWVSSACFSPRLQKTIALGMIKYDYLAPGTQASITSVDGEHNGQIADLPFVRGSWFDTGAPEPEKDT